jgi:hypothetical protein
LSDLSDCARHEHYITLSNSLPPPVLNESEYRDRRLVTAVETFNALRPGDAYEARLAVQIVLCGAHADECLRLAGHYRDDFAKMTRCRAQAASMMRAECSAKRTLEQEQSTRLAVEAMARRAARQAEATAAPPQQADLQAPPPVQLATAGAPPVRLAAAAPPSAPVSSRVTPPRLAATNPAPQPVQAGSASPPSPEAIGMAAAASSPSPEAIGMAAAASSPSPEAIAKAEAFAQREIVAAAQIRHDRGVTPQIKAYFRHVALPSDPSVIDALVRGSTDALTMLDEVGGEVLDAAA